MAGRRGGRRLTRDQLDAVLRRLMPLKRTWPADRVIRRDPATYQEASVIETWRCRNPACREFVPRGSRKARMCLICFTPMPKDV